ncbi:MAG: hypothetical protein HY897_20625 [Deltaproteobacteria bacterium]|nr:hypothetical protein [Deltaproteobacteria bacterium]
MSCPRNTGFLVETALVAALAASCAGARDVSPRNGGEAGAADVGTATPLLAAAASVDITPTEYETFRDCGGDDLCPGDRGYPGPDEGEADLIWNEGEKFLDCGIDRLCDVDEPGYDAVSNPDPAGDNFDKSANPGGTEGNRVFDTIYMGGFQGVVLIPYTGKPIQGVHDPIFAKILVLKQADLTLVHISFDVVGLFHKYVNAIKRELHASTGVAKDNVIVSSLHNHEGPDTMGIWSPPTDLVHDNKGVNQRYILKVLDNVVAAAGVALSRVEPALLTTASAWLPSCVDRASGVLEEFPDCAEPPRTSLAFDPAYDEPILARDSRDPYVRDMRVLAFRLDSAGTGKTIATLANWNNHPESLGSLNPLVSADFPGYVRAYIENRFGGEAIYLNGALGGMMTPLGARAPLWSDDFAPVTDADGRRVMTTAESSFEKAMGIGYETAHTACEALAASRPLHEPALKLETAEIEVPVNSNYRNLFTLTDYLSPRDNTYEDPQDLSKSEEERARLVALCGQSGCVKVPIHVIGIGDVQIVTHPGEAFTEYEVGRSAAAVAYGADGFPPYDFPAIEGLRGRMCGAHNMFFALTEHELGYAVPESDVLPADHPNYYEESVSAHPEYGDIVYGALLKMVDSACGR